MYAIQDLDTQKYLNGTYRYPCFNSLGKAKVWGENQLGPARSTLTRLRKKYNTQPGSSVPRRFAIVVLEVKVVEVLNS